MKSAIFAAMLAVAACKGKTEKETVIVTTAPPNQPAADPTAPLPAGNPNPTAAPAAQPVAATAPVEPAPTGGTMTQPARPVAPDAGIIPDAIDTNGLMPEH